MRLEQLVDLEEQSGVEEDGRVVEGGVEVVGGAVHGTRREGAGGATRAGAEGIAMGGLTLEPGARSLGIPGEVRQLAPRLLVVQRGQDGLREPIAQPERQRGDQRCSGGDGTSATATASTGGSGGAGGAAGGLTRSTRVPAMRSCSARLSRRNPAMT